MNIKQNTKLVARAIQIDIQVEKEACTHDDDDDCFYYFQK